MEAQAVFQGFYLVFLMGILLFVIETDCLMESRKVFSSNLNFSHEGDFVQAIRQLLLRHVSVAVRHVRREANGVAHYLAHCGLVIGRSHLGNDQFPPQVQILVDADPGIVC